MAPAAAISLDRFRRNRQAAAQAQTLAPEAPHPLVGMALGMADRRYGLMSSREVVSVTEVVATSGDLAIADRLAFMAAAHRPAMPVVVVELDGWYIACVPSHAMDISDYAALQPSEGMQSDGVAAPRVMSVVTSRGITPVLGPLAAV